MSDAKDNVRSMQPEGLELRADGTVRAVIGGQTIRLRRPKMGELRMLRERWREVNDEGRSVSVDLESEGAQIRQQLEQAQNENDWDEVKRLRKADMDRARQVTDDAERRYISYVRWLFNGDDHEGAEWTGLADKQLPGDDELEAYMGSVEFAGALLQHFAAVPLARGVPRAR